MLSPWRLIHDPGCHRPPPRLLTLIGLTGLSTLSLNLFLPSLAHMAQDFETSYALVSLAVAGYLGMTAVLQLILGPLSDRFGRRPVALAALLIFVLASLGCLFATDIEVFLAFRMLQGVMIAGWAVALAAIRDTALAQEAASRIGYLSMAMALAPMLGPVLGGVLDAAFGWRASFLTFAALGIVLLGLCWLDFGETHHNRFEHDLAAIPSLPGAVPDTALLGLCFVYGVFHRSILYVSSPNIASKRRRNL